MERVRKKGWSLVLALEWWAIGRDEARSKAGAGLWRTFAQCAQESQSLSWRQTTEGATIRLAFFFFFFWLQEAHSILSSLTGDRTQVPCSGNAVWLPWTTRRIPRLAFYKALVDKQNQGPCADKQLVRKTSQRGGGIHLSARSNVQLGSEEPESPPASEGRRGEPIWLQVSQRGKRLTQSLWLRGALWGQDPPLGISTPRFPWAGNAYPDLSSRK